MKLWLLLCCLWGQTPLTAEQAVDTALRSNPTAQAWVRQVDISQAELDQASTLVNPNFEVMARFPDHSGIPNNTEYSLSWNLLDLLRRADREELASTRVQQARLEVEDKLLELGQEVRAEFFEVQALQQLVEQLEIVLQAADAATELHRRQYKAGNISQLDLAQQEAASIEARVSLEQARAELDQARMRLRLLLGSDSEFSVGMLAELPQQDAGLEGLEELALKQRPDLALARLEVRADLQEEGLAAGGLLDEVSFGVSREEEAEHDGPIVTGPSLSFPVPIFDRREGASQAFAYKAEQSRHLVEARERQVRTEVRLAHSKMRAMRMKTERLRDELIPKRRQVLRLARPYYDAMLIGVYTLLELRQQIAHTRQELIEAQRDYWVARASLERAIGGPLPR